jgi:hypothetical protein
MADNEKLFNFVCERSHYGTGKVKKNPQQRSHQKIAELNIFIKGMHK